MRGGGGKFIGRLQQRKHTITLENNNAKLYNSNMKSITFAYRNTNRG
jgi:hypothetical protein